MAPLGRYFSAAAATSCVLAMLLALTTVQGAVVEGATSAPWSEEPFVGRRRPNTNISANFAIDLGYDIAGVDAASLLRIQNVTIAPTAVDFVLAAPSDLFERYAARAVNLTAQQLETLGLTLVMRPSAATPAPIDEKENTWIFGVVAGGLLVAGSSVAFAEYAARGARARRRARQGQPAMHAGMLSDN